MNKRDINKLQKQVAQWRAANPQGSRQRFIAYLIAIDAPVPLTGMLVRLWREYDAIRDIETPETIDDAVAVLIQSGEVLLERGEAALRYLVEVGQVQEFILESV